MEDKLNKFCEQIGITFSDLSLLRQALTHRSYINENRNSGLEHNERLEFLGDAVLELVVTDYLFHEYPDKTEGTMTSYRAALVNTNTLADTAWELGMNDYLLLSKGESKDSGRARSIILADSLEALIGAIYLDQGYDRARDFIAEKLFPKTADIVANNLWLDAKSFFQEKAQEVDGFTPNYEVVKEEGPDHNKVFTVALYVGDEKVSIGIGHSKQEAEQKAAREGLLKKGWA